MTLRSVVPLVFLLVLVAVAATHVGGTVGVAVAAGGGVVAGATWAARFRHNALRSFSQQAR